MGDAGPAQQSLDIASTSGAQYNGLESQEREVTVLVTGFGVC